MPNESLKGLSTPNTGDLPGAWGTAAVNANMQVIGGYLGGSQAISLSSSSATTLSISTGVIGTGSITAGAGPTQVANRVIKLTGTLSSNCVITFPCPGSWIIKNSCTVGAFYVQLRAAGTGNVIGVPPGEAVEVFNDGTDFDFMNLGRVGDPIDLPVSTTPAWMGACTLLPYLPCIGTATYSSSLYPALAAMLGSTYGGNGINTFAPPDCGNRLTIPLGTRITSSTGGIDGSVLGNTGGTTQVTISAGNLPSHTHTYTDPGHGHRFQIANGGGDDSSGGLQTDIQSQQSVGPTAAFDPSGTNGEQIAASTTRITIAATPNGTTPLNIVMPCVFFGTRFIRAG